MKLKSIPVIDDEQSSTSTPTPAVPNPVKPRAKPTTSLKHIKRIYSHPQAFGQCDIFLDAYLKGIERIDKTSTSKAAEEVKYDTTGTSASISSKIAAEIQGLNVLAEGIEDRTDNTTRFFVLRKGSDAIDIDPSTITSANGQAITRSTKSIVTFTVHHDSPGALADVLHCFQTHKLNLTSINSRPSRLVPFQYIFLIEFQGSKFDDARADVEAALRELEQAAQSSRWWGSWVDRLKVPRT